MSTLRSGNLSDIPAVLALWREAEAEPTHTDDLLSLTKLIERDPRALVVAEVEGQIVGSVIAGWDGWRGSIYRLAVAPEARRAGLGRRLVTEAEQRLAGLGARRLQTFVVATDAQATGFWRSSGWEEQVERLRFVMG
jgi:ribosomal protein S18 acetylase RimI-like enzyme